MYREENTGTPPGAGVVARTALVACALLYCVPLFLCVIQGAGFLDLANEPLAYRFFYPEKLLSGDYVRINVGALVGVLHHAVYAAMQTVPDIAGASLERRLNLFALLTNGIMSAGLCALLVLAARSSRLQASDLALLGMAALVPLFATGGWGFEFALMADYTFLSMVLSVASLLLFQLYWRRGDVPTHTFEVIALAAFAGMAAANKPTLLVVAGAALVPALFNRAYGWRASGIRALLALAGLLFSFIFVHFVSHLGDARATMATLSWWVGYVQNPGGEPGFGNALWASMLKYNYALFAGFGVGALLVAVAGFEIGGNRTLRAMAAGTFCMLGLAASVWFVTKRPAHTTLFDSALFIFVLGAMLLTTVSGWRPARTFIAGSCVAWALVALFTFPLKSEYELVAGSAERSKIKWDAFAQVRNIAGTRPIEVIIPDNRFHHEGVFELLVKAASTFPHWKPSPGGEALIFGRYAPGLAVRYIGDVPGPGAPYAGGRLLVWFDRPEAGPLTTQYPGLAAAVGRTGVVQYAWRLPRRGGLIYPAESPAVTMRAAVIPASS